MRSKAGCSERIPSKETAGRRSAMDRLATNSSGAQASLSSSTSTSRRPVRALSARAKRRSSAPMADAMVIIGSAALFIYFLRWSG